MTLNIQHGAIESLAMDSIDGPETTKAPLPSKEADLLVQQITVGSLKDQPLIDVIPGGDGRYRLLFGADCWHSYASLNAATHIRARVLPVEAATPQYWIDLAQSKEARVMDIARGVKAWLHATAPRRSQRDAAEAFGRNPTQIARLIKLAEAPELIQIRSGVTHSLNILDSMHRVYRLNLSGFAEALRRFDAKDFTGRSEQYWREHVARLSGRLAASPTAMKSAKANYCSTAISDWALLPPEQLAFLLQSGRYRVAIANHNDDFAILLFDEQEGRFSHALTYLTKRLQKKEGPRIKWHDSWIGVKAELKRLNVSQKHFDLVIVEGSE
jgi:hypothetical protein